MREIFSTLCLAGAIQSLFLALVLAIRRNNRDANRFLSVYLVFMALDAFELSLGARGITCPALSYQLSIVPYSLVLGPSMYLYIALLTARIDRFGARHLLLFVPAALAMAANAAFILLFDPADLPRPVILTNMATNGGGLVFEAVFYIMALQVLRRYMNRLKEYFSDIDSLKLSFIRAGLVFVLVTIPFIFIPYTAGHPRHQHEVLDAIAILSALVFVFVMAFVAILQPEIFNRVRLLDRAVPTCDGTTGPRYEKFRLAQPLEEEYAVKLKRYMEENKPYLDEELTVQDLADAISLPVHQLSMILNIHFRQNFYNFVNGYRIEDVKQKLADPAYDDHNILTIAYNSGFNSKSTFNTMFRKFTGKTPREYRTGLFL